MIRNTFTHKGLLAVSVIGLLLALSACQTRPVVRSGHVVIGDERSRVAVVFSDHDRKLIDEFYRQRHQHKYKKSKGRGKGLPPGLAKREQLPPGLQKQIARRGTLPPGLQGKALPYELEHRLSPLPEGYARVRIGADIVLLDQNTRIMVDVIKSIADD